MAGIAQQGGTASDAGADVFLFDYVSATFHAFIQNTGEDACDRLASVLRQRCRRFSIGLSGVAKFEMAVDTGGTGALTATVTIHADDVEDGLLIRGSSKIETNLLTFVRSVHQISDRIIGLDGKRNLCGPTADRSDRDVQMQIDAFSACAEQLRELLGEAFPDAVLADGGMKLRAAEVGHDLLCVDGDAVVRAACRVPRSGSRSSWQMDYECKTGSGRVPAYHFEMTKHGPKQKGYLKYIGWDQPGAAHGRDLVRTEVSCLTRKAVVACVGEPTQAPLSAEGAAQLLREFHRPAANLCQKALDHTRRVAAGLRTRVDLKRALVGLHAIADGKRGSIGYVPSAKATRDAERVLNALYDTGIADASGLRRGTKVRDELERLVRPGGPLVRGASSCVYCVAPEFGMGTLGAR